MFPIRSITVGFLAVFCLGPIAVEPKDQSRTTGDDRPRLEVAGEHSKQRGRQLGSKRRAVPDHHDRLSRDVLSHGRQHAAGREIQS